MSVTIQIPTVLRRFTANQEEVAVQAISVNEALKLLVNDFPALHRHLYDETGKLRSFVNVYLADRDVRHLEHKHESKLAEGDVLTIVPSIAGGVDAAE